MLRFIITISLIVSDMAIMASTTRGDDFITKQQRRMRLPTVISPHSVVVATRARLLVREDSRAELKLTEEQEKRIDTLLADWCVQSVNLTRAPFGTLQGEAEIPDRAGRRHRNDAQMRLSEKTLEALREMLTPDQQQRLDQLVLQLQGISSLATRDLTEKLNLDEEQLNQIGTIRRSARPGVAIEGKPTPHEQILNLLTPEQRRQWETMIGKPLFPPPSGRSGIGVVSQSFHDVRTPLSLVRHESVRTALQLTAEQQRQIAAPVVAWLDARIAWDESLIAGADKKQRDAVAGRMQAAVDAATRALETTLTEKQMSRLGQIERQQAGIFAFRNPQVLEELNLSEKQREKIRELLDKAQDRGQLADDAKQQLNRDALVILTDEQRQKWNEMLGDPVDLNADK